MAKMRLQVLSSSHGDNTYMVKWHSYLVFPDDREREGPSQVPMFMEELRALKNM